MNNQPPCERCGKPSRVHITDEDAFGNTVTHLCLECAAAEEQRPHARESELNHAAILTSVGVVVVLLSALADYLGFGSAGEFGWKQNSGIVLAIILMSIAAVMRVPTILVIGLLTGVITALADWTEFGSSPGFGIRQMLGVLLGIVLIALGCVVGRKQDHSR